jgi:protein phosphatase
VKTVVFSDSHANYAAMKAIFDQEKQFDRVIFLGDAILFGPEPEEVVTALREMDALCLMGNHDEELFYLDSITEMDHPEHLDWLRWTRDRLSPENIEFMKNRFETTRTADLDGRPVRLHHGNFDFGSTTRLFPDSPAAHFDEIAGMFPEDTILLGHSHIQHDLRHGGMRFINPGSAGHTRLGNPESCYLIVEDGEFRFEAAEYDIERTVRGMENLPLPENFKAEWVKSFRTGTVSPIYDIKDFSGLKAAGYR